jgi:hypothetical protein
MISNTKMTCSPASSSSLSIPTPPLFRTRLRRGDAYENVAASKGAASERVRSLYNTRRTRPTGVSAIHSSRNKENGQTAQLLNLIIFGNAIDAETTKDSDSNPSA